MRIGRTHSIRMVKAMTAVRLPKFKVISILIALTLTFSLASASPAGRGSKSRKPSARSGQKSVKSKAKARNSKVSARGRSSRSNKLNARASRRGAKGRTLSARGRGRSHRSRWRSQVASSSASHHSSGVHNFLAREWTKAQSPSERVAPSGQNESETPLFAEPSHVLEVENAGAINPDAAKPRMPNEVSDEVPPMNPLVAAYTDSLAARGFEPDNQGFIITTLKGEVLAEHNADRLFNPASVTKIATSLTAISRLGPDFKFRTALYTDGAVDPATGILHGSLYVIGSGDPVFFYENAIMIADKLNRAGIREVEGNLMVLGQFYFNFSTSREASAKAFRYALSADTWNAAAKSAYPRFLAMRAAEGRINDASAQQSQQAPWTPGPPSLKINGETQTDPTVNTTSLKLLAVHTSLPLVSVLKGLNDFSNNWMATVIGNLVGGTDAVERFLKTEVGFKDDEVQFATPSGLGANSISPRGTISMLRKLIAYLDSKGLMLENILPIAGVDAGTLQRRYTDAFRGSIVGKTGTLNGVSALAGVAYTRSKGPLLFVIYNRGGSAHTFRVIQDETMKKIITLFGGPAPVRYAPAGEARVSQRTEPMTRSASSNTPR
jgi:D-alanyl-D-alanine carboxypeptidase/D-alanyl-D-alanine-endopeptidase (penicillin-binding protein 4)